MNFTVSKGNAHEKRKKNLFCCGEGQALEQVAQRGSGVPVCGNIEPPLDMGLGNLPRLPLLEPRGWPGWPRAAPSRPSGSVAGVTQVTPISQLLLKTWNLDRINEGRELLTRERFSLENRFAGTLCKQLLFGVWRCASHDFENLDNYFSTSWWKCFALMQRCYDARSGINFIDMLSNQYESWETLWASL